MANVPGALTTAAGGGVCAIATDSPRDAAKTEAIFM
jgi:hypothetical protein